MGDCIMKLTVYVLLALFWIGAYGFYEIEYMHTCYRWHLLTILLVVYTTGIAYLVFNS